MPHKDSMSDRDGNAEKPGQKIGMMMPAQITSAGSAVDSIEPPSPGSRWCRDR